MAITSESGKSMAYLPYSQALLYAKLVGLMLYKMIIWSAVVAGCGIMALLGRHAAIHRFGTDHFTGNVLFTVFFSLVYFSVFNP